MFPRKQAQHVPLRPFSRLDGNRPLANGIDFCVFKTNRAKSHLETNQKNDSPFMKSLSKSKKPHLTIETSSRPFPKSKQNIVQPLPAPSKKAPSKNQKVSIGKMHSKILVDERDRSRSDFIEKTQKQGGHQPRCSIGETAFIPYNLQILRKKVIQKSIAYKSQLQK